MARRELAPLEAMQKCGHVSPLFLSGLVDVGSFRDPHHLDVGTFGRPSDEESAGPRPTLGFS